MREDVVERNRNLDRVGDHARVALHTRTELVPAIVQRADAEHPYEVPCVIATPVIAGNPAYVQWVLDETAGIQPHP
ncbi:divalent cation tolerance protein CutA [Micromonospora sp. CPCC 205556]|uniref:divalent cation tolerance protein CutA n=1 Tax=Micromonospora sp. CPCC 205556 TaxID=3122398 RepID=UPI002FF17360